MNSPVNSDNENEEENDIYANAMDIQFKEIEQRMAGSEDEDSANYSDGSEYDECNS